MLRTFGTTAMCTVLLLGLGACKKKAAKEGAKSESAMEAAKGMEGGEGMEPAAMKRDAPKVVARKTAAKGPVSSCDQRKKKGICTDAFQAAWSVGEKQVKSNCRRGVFAKTPCPTENLLGYCSMGAAYRVAFYSGTSRKYDQTKAEGLCKKFYEGKYKAK